MTRTIRLFLGVVVVALAADGAQGGVFRDVVRGLEFAGFQFVGQENPLSGGAEFQLFRTFNNETLDFGGTELTLSGPIAFSFETGGRFLPVLDVSLNTRNQPLNYTLDMDVGGQQTVIDGSMLLDATGNINAFGFYDFEFTYSVREQITQDGRFANDEEFVDFDLGPINVSGNVFSDMLAVLFDPFFASTGGFNPFASFSGRFQAEEELNRRLDEARNALLGGDFAASGYGVAYDAGAFAYSMQDGAGSDIQFTAVPEPSVLLLLIAAAPLAISARRPRR